MVEHTRSQSTQPNYQSRRTFSLYECAKPGVLLLELAPDDVALVEEDGAPDDGELVLEARDEALRAQERRRLQTEELHERDSIDI